MQQLNAGGCSCTSYQYTISPHFTGLATNLIHAAKAYFIPFDSANWIAMKSVPNIKRAKLFY